jgi:hypothetical protein
MGEFLEHVRQENIKINGVKNPYKRMRPKE